MQILQDLRAQRDGITQAIAELESLNGTTASPSPARKTAKTAAPGAPPPSFMKRLISPEARERIAEAQWKRWAKKRKAEKAAAKRASAKTAKETEKA
jgi:hypothetical protein